MICENCGHYWVAVYPVGAERLECPECGYMTRLPPTSTSTSPSAGDNEAWVTSWVPDYA